MTDEMLDKMRIEMTPWMKFLSWLVIATFAGAMIVFQVKGNTENIAKNTEADQKHAKMDSGRHAELIERIHGTELLQKRIDTSLGSIDRRFDRLERYLMQYDFEKKRDE